MFSAETYIERRNKLKKQIDSGLILLLGNEESSINYPDVHYPFRQDSSFLYFFGLDFAGLAAVIDIDADSVTIFGSDLTIDEIIWTGTQPTINQKAAAVGVSKTDSLTELEKTIQKAVKQNKTVHYLPPYRAEHLITLEKLTGIPHKKIAQNASPELIKAVVALREKKSQQEIEQIKTAIDISYRMHSEAMKISKPGKYEQEIAGLMEGIAIAAGGRLAFPTIFSIHGQTLHNPCYHNIMKAGDIAVNDCGAESAMHYASDITRTIPIGGKFDSRQKDIYNIVFNAQTKAIEATRAGAEFRDIHLLACRILAEGLKNLDLMKGDPEQAVNAGAHALFFQCGLGHQMGLDVHDMEGLGEQYVGYTKKMKKNKQFGLKSLRLGKKLQPGFIITVEPGIYFIPELIDIWKAENKFSDFINYSEVEKYKDFGGIRLEDNILVTESGSENLSKHIPKKADEVEALASS
jgi:Xaa-Pro aminopeptidase